MPPPEADTIVRYQEGRGSRDFDTRLNRAHEVVLILAPAQQEQQAALLRSLRHDLDSLQREQQRLAAKLNR